MTTTPRRTFSRRTLLAATLTGAGAWALSACGSGGMGSQASSGEMRDFVDAEGNTISIPVKPKRIVALSEPTIDGCVALGITPLGTIAGRGQSTVPSHLLDKAGDVPIVGTVQQLNYEAIGALAPDLLVVDGTSVNNSPQEMAALREIGPTVVTGFAGGDWRKNITFLSDAVGDAKGGEKIIADYNKRVEKMKKKLAEKYPGKTYSIVRWQGTSASVILKELPAGRTLVDLEMTRPPSQDRVGGGHSEPVSLENMQDIDADFMFFGSLGGSSVGNPNAGGAADKQAGQEALAEAEAVPGFKDLKAYKEGHVFPVDGAAWTSTGGPVLINTILDDIEEYLL